MSGPEPEPSAAQAAESVPAVGASTASSGWEATRSPLVGAQLRAGDSSLAEMLMALGEEQSTKTVLSMQRTVGNRAVARALRPDAPSRTAVPATPALVRSPSIVAREKRKAPFPVVPEHGDTDAARRFQDPADKQIKPVWTPENGYTKNPSARPLEGLLVKGRIRGGFENGKFMYVVDGEGQVILGKRLGEDSSLPGRAKGMPHPCLVGGKNPTVVGAGEVDIRNGRIFKIDNQSGHFQPSRNAVGTAVKGFMRLPKTAFDPQFAAESVHYDATGAETRKPFRSLGMLKLRAGDLKRALSHLKPKHLAGKMRSRGFRSGAKSFGRGLAAALAMLALQYLLGKWMEKIQAELIDKQIDELAPVIETKLADRHEELEALLEEDSEAPIYVNIRFGLVVFQVTRGTPAGPQSAETLPMVVVQDVGFGRQPWDSTPVETVDINCLTPTRTTSVAVSEAIDPKELFGEEQSEQTPEDAEQPAVK